MEAARIGRRINMRMFEREIHVVCPDHTYDKKMVMRAMRRKQLSPKYEGLGGIKEIEKQIKWDMEHAYNCTDYTIQLSPIKLVEHNFPPLK
jgi:hypothetical protein